MLETDGFDRPTRSDTSPSDSENSSIRRAQARASSTGESCSRATFSTSASRSESRSSASRTSAGTVGEARLPCRPPAPLAGDQLEPAGVAAADEHRLDHALRAHRVGEPVRGLGVVALARLARVRVDRLDRELGQLRLGRAADQDFEAAAEAAAGACVAG